MSWVTPDDIEAIYPDFDASQEFVDHVQHLAESCAGVVAEPVSPQLRATFIDVVYRKWLAMENNPEGTTQETLGPYMVQMPSVPGLGLTKNECRALRTAARRPGLTSIPVGSGPLETPPRHDATETIEEVFG